MRWLGHVLWIMNDRLSKIVFVLVKNLLGLDKKQVVPNGVVRCCNQRFKGNDNFLEKCTDGGLE